MRRVYFSFDYEQDLHRVKNICRLPRIISRSAAGFETSAVWQQVTKEGEDSLKGLINDALMKTSITIVCISNLTAYTKIQGYEIERSLEHGNGLLGLKIKHLKGKDGLVGTDGTAPAAIEANGYNIYQYTGPKLLLRYIEEAADLATIEKAERLARKN